MAKRIKVKAGENLSDENIERVIAYLEEPKATKKVACEMLGIAYNTKRLQTIVDNYTERAAIEKRLRAKKRGTPVEIDEAKTIIVEYLTSGSIDATAKSHFRPISVIHKTIDKYGARLRAPRTDYFDPQMLPDECVSDSFEPGEYVWSTRYNTLAQVRKKIENQNAYQIWVMGRNAQNSFQPPEELGKLSHLEALGIDFTKLEFYYDDYMGE